MFPAELEPGRVPEVEIFETAGLLVLLDAVVVDPGVGFLTLASSAARCFNISIEFCWESSTLRFLATAPASVFEDVTAELPLVRGAPLVAAGFDVDVFKGRDSVVLVVVVVVAVVVVAVVAFTAGVPSISQQQNVVSASQLNYGSLL